MAGILISAARKSSGKTSFSIGLAALLQEKGYSVQAFKKGPDYIDPMWLAKASRRSCINLDFYTMPRVEIERSYEKYTRDADMVVVEGNKGLYDGMDVNGSDCSAALAELLGLPVVLLLDAGGITRGIAPLLHGYQTFDDAVNIAGVVLNKVQGARHEDKLRNAITRYTDIPILGAIRRTKDMEIEERHIGLTPSNEDGNARKRIERMAGVISESVDVDRLISLSARLKSRPGDLAASRASPAMNSIRLGIARDEAFAFYYPDDFQVMQDLGVKLVFFDAIRDTRLPDIDALFIGGGFPELYLKELERNTGLKVHIKQFIDAGYPVYAECGGLMYLCRDITYNNSTHSMVGALNARAKMKTRPVGRGYVQLIETSNHPWPGIDSDSQSLPAHEFHYSQLEDLDADAVFAYRVTRGVGIKQGLDGLIHKNTLATYSHHRNVGQNHWVERFIAHVRKGLGSYRC